MRVYRYPLFILLIAIFALVGCEQSKSPLSNPAAQTNDDAALSKSSPEGTIVIANRASGSISLIDVNTDVVTQTLNLPTAEHASEPMYVVYSHLNRTVFVGDRGNDRVVAYDAETFDVKTTIPTGKGVFHMWADPRGNQLWVNNDIDKTITVIDPMSFDMITTIPIPKDLADMGGKPHDVILDPIGKYAYISVLGLPGNDVIVQYTTKFFVEIGRAEVGKDPHLSLTQKNNLLYVPCQNSDAVFLLDRDTMQQVDVLMVPGAHGAGMPLQGKTFYTTNLPGGGPDGLWSIDVSSNTILAHTDTPFAVPHNIALTPLSEKLYLTHSGGSSNKVSIYTIPDGEQVPQLKGSVDVGFNPFGLAYAN